MNTQPERCVNGSWTRTSLPRSRSSSFWKFWGVIGCQEFNCVCKSAPGGHKPEQHLLLSLLSFGTTGLNPFWKCIQLIDIYCLSIYMYLTVYNEEESQGKLSGKWEFKLQFHENFESVVLTLLFLWSVITAPRLPDLLAHKLIGFLGHQHSSDSTLNGCGVLAIGLQYHLGKCVHQRGKRALVPS